MNSMIDLHIDNLTYFIEDLDSHRWYDEENHLTLDALEALSFESAEEADNYALTKDLRNYIITEHQFI